MQRLFGAAAPRITSLLRAFDLACTATPASTSGRALAAPLVHLRSFFGSPSSSGPPALEGSPSQVAAAPAARESLEEIRARIFGSHIGNGLRSGRKVLRRKLVGPTLVGWYPQDMTKTDPLLLNLDAERAKVKLDRLRRRGKAPPKKGAGKRSKTKK